MVRADHRWILGFGLAMATSAAAAEVRLVPVAGEPEVGREATLHLAMVDDTGDAALVVPTLTAASGRVSSGPTPVEPGVWSFTWVAPDAPGEVGFMVSALGRDQATSLVVVAPAPSSLTVPSRVEAVAGEGAVTFRVTGADLPPPEALQVAFGEGQVRSVTARDGGLDVALQLGPATSARIVPIALRDLRRHERPATTWVRVRSRGVLPLQTEPGATLTLTVGKRTWGPYVADATGKVAAAFEQGPDDVQAVVAAVDDLGNETRTTVPLAVSAAAALLLMPEAELVAGRAAPRLWAYASQGDGGAWTGAAPTCRTPLVDKLEVTAAGKGLYAITLAGPSGPDVRVRCALGRAIEAEARVAVVPGPAATLDVRLFPESPSADFPVAEVSVVVADLAGTRIRPTGVSVTADRGLVRVVTDDGESLRLDYDGAAAVAAGEDRVSVNYRAPPSARGVVDEIVVSHGAVGAVGPTEVRARLLDRVGMPVVGASVLLGAGGAPAVAVSGPDGWAVASVPTPPGDGPVVLVASTSTRVGRSVAARGAVGRVRVADGPPTGPDEPDRVVVRELSLRRGRVARIELSVEPRILYAGPSAVAIVHARVRDRNGGLLDVPPDPLEVGAGAAGVWIAQPDGSWLAEYSPPPRARTLLVDLTARAEGASSSTSLSVEPLPVDRSASFIVGATSNFGLIVSPWLAADAEVRSPWVGRRLMLRLGAGYYSVATKVDTGVGEGVPVQMSLFPLTAGLVARGDFAGEAFWGGLGVVFCPQRSETRFSGGGGATEVRVSMLPPGLSMIGGYGRRLGTGELLIELRATTLVSQGQNVAFEGQVGGVSVGLGYRIVY